MNDLTKEYPITSLTREDLLDAGFPPEVVEALSDEAMLEIASLIADVHCQKVGWDESYWEDVQECARRVLRKSGKDHDEN